MIAPSFDIEPFVPMYPTTDASIRAPRNPMGPIDICRVEMLRLRELREIGIADRKPCDLLLMGLGEAPVPFITKVGGVPFRPRTAAWPKWSDTPWGVTQHASLRDNPLNFVAQFYFGESRDIIPRTPEDVLLVFSVDIQVDHGLLYFEWWPSNCRVIGAPPLEWPVSSYLECHGYRYRTFDYASEDDIDSIDTSPRFNSARVLGGTKIGGIPPKPGKGHGAFLCSLGSMYPNAKNLFPWVNQRRWSTDNIPQGARVFEAYDDGTLQFYLDSDNYVQCVSAAF